MVYSSRIIRQRLNMHAHSGTRGVSTAARLLRRLRANRLTDLSHRVITHSVDYFVARASASESADASQK